MSTSPASRVIIAAACIVALLVANAAWGSTSVKRSPQAAPPNAPVAASASAGTSTPATSDPDAISLATLSHVAGPLRLTGESASRSITLALSARERVRDAVLHLVVSNSISLLTDRSQLDVRVNDHTIAQIQLSSRQPETTADIRVPTQLLHPGDNTVSFAAAQHSAETCEDPTAPELWTEIDTGASLLRMHTDLAPLAPTLADLPDLIDGNERVTPAMAIVTASHPSDDRQLQNGSLVVQGIALRLGDIATAPRVVTAQPGSGAGMLPGLELAPLADADLVLLGTRDALRPYLDARTIGQINGAFLGIYSRPDDARHFLLVVSGRDEREVERAARMFSHNEVPLPRRSELVVSELNETTPSPWSTNHIVEGTAPHTLRSLGFTSRTLRPGDQADIDVRLPADIYAPEDAKVMFDMNFNEGAKMRADSVLNIALNGRFEQAIALDRAEGAVIRHYRINMPLRDFRAGSNTLSLRPSLVPLMVDRCASRQTDNLQLTVFDDSTLQLPRASHFTTLPNLQRFADSGFPYTVQPDGRGLAVQLASHDDDTIAAAWALMGRLAQSQGAPLTATQLTFGNPSSEHANVIAFGAVAALPTALLQGAPWAPGKTVRVAKATAYATAGADVGDAQADGAGLPGVKRFFGTSTHEAESEVLLRGDMTLSRQLLVMQYRGERGGATTVFTAADGAQLLGGVRRLIERSYWSALRGNIALLTFDHPDLWTARVGDTYEVGSIGPLDWLGYTLSNHPWIGYAAVVALLAIFSMTSALLLKRYHRKRHRGSQE